MRYICYAHALHTSQKQFEKWHKLQGEFCDYLAMRDEMSNLQFGGSIAALESYTDSTDVDYAASSSGGFNGND